MTWGKKNPHRGFTPFLSPLQATCDRSLRLRVERRQPIPVRGRMIIFGTDIARQVLAEASEWMMDTTLKMTPALFFQLLIIRALFHGHVMVCLYAIMANHGFL